MEGSIFFSSFKPVCIYFSNCTLFRLSFSYFNTAFVFFFFRRPLLYLIGSVFGSYICESSFSSDLWYVHVNTHFVVLRWRSLPIFEHDFLFASKTSFDNKFVGRTSIGCQFRVLVIIFSIFLFLSPDTNSLKSQCPSVWCIPWSLLVINSGDGAKSSLIKRLKLRTVEVANVGTESLGVSDTFSNEIKVQSQNNGF